MIDIGWIPLRASGMKSLVIEFGLTHVSLNLI